MNKSISRCLLLVFLVAPCAAHAGLYKGVSSKGEVVYSDIPFRNSEEFSAPPVAVVEMPDVILDKVISESAAKAEKAEKEKVQAQINKQVDTKYAEFRIVSPKDKQSIWNNPDLAVSMKIKPPLKAANGHRIWLLLDGQVLVDNSTQLDIPTGRLERGEHTLQTQVRNSKGKLIMGSKPVVVYIHYGSAK